MKKIDALIDKVLQNSGERLTVSFLEQTAFGYELTCHITKGEGEGVRQVRTVHETEELALEALDEVARAYPSKRQGWVVITGEGDL